MADFGRKLPKWQPLQILCQTPCHFDISKYHAIKKIFFFLIFFSCMDDNVEYNRGMMMNDNLKDTKMTFQYGENVVVERKGKVMFGQIASVRVFRFASLLVVQYTDGEDTWYRSYYTNDPATKIEHDEIFA